MFTVPRRCSPAPANCHRLPYTQRPIQLPSFESSLLPGTSWKPRYSPYQHHFKPSLPWIRTLPSVQSPSTCPDSGVDGKPSHPISPVHVPRPTPSLPYHRHYQPKVLTRTSVAMQS
ncbi:hypothetical protein K491DRAFT_242778 [Lophiostoma macrostomum CBS 122681]|uniref:Uncharacterized protein n=1 Tax=Lophiostoma macrostomum CBS 122681 TaxID=1314788 RepID=A0A6A6SM03_9PLEO|nr:hypothetical protein K491DRAFT_242778 [Lophiostoma macrostomum CBS 122681]